MNSFSLLFSHYDERTLSVLRHDFLSFSQQNTRQDIRTFFDPKGNSFRVRTLVKVPTDPEGFPPAEVPEPVHLGLRPDAGQVGLIPAPTHTRLRWRSEYLPSNSFKNISLKLFTKRLSFTILLSLFTHLYAVFIDLYLFSVRRTVY